MGKSIYRNFKFCKRNLRGTIHKVFSMYEANKLHIIIVNNLPNFISNNYPWKVAVFYWKDKQNLSVYIDTKLKEGCTKEGVFIWSQLWINGITFYSDEINSKAIETTSAEEQELLNGKYSYIKNNKVF